MEYISSPEEKKKKKLEMVKIMEVTDREESIWRVSVVVLREFRSEKKRERSEEGTVE